MQINLHWIQLKITVNLNDLSYPYAKDSFFNGGMNDENSGRNEE